MNFDKKLVALKASSENKCVKIMLTGLGSVGEYLLDYLLSLSDESLEIIVAGRSYDKMISDVNIVKVASAIRQQNKSKVIIESGCDLNNEDSVRAVISKHCPDILVNTSRVYSGLKYGSISWSKFRAYGIWAPLAVKYIKLISAVVNKESPKTMVINTSYSDAINPWIKGATGVCPEFGSGNINHLIPRLKFAAAEQLGIADFWNVDVTMATSHFHDVVISKEGHSETMPQLLNIKYKGKELDFKQEKLFSKCKIAMPVDQKRNMMNASSNLEIITALLSAVRAKKVIKIHTPGAMGEIGGYPFMIDGSKMSGYFDETVFSMTEMRRANRQSIAFDGIENVSGDTLTYTDKLIEAVKAHFKVTLPKSVSYGESDGVAEFIIENIIKKAI